MTLCCSGAWRNSQLRRFLQGIETATRHEVLATQLTWVTPGQAHCSALCTCKALRLCCTLQWLCHGCQTLSAELCISLQSVLFACLHCPAPQMLHPVSVVHAAFPGPSPALMVSALLPPPDAPDFYTTKNKTFIGTWLLNSVMCGQTQGVVKPTWLVYGHAMSFTQSAHASYSVLNCIY